MQVFLLASSRRRRPALLGGPPSLRLLWRVGPEAYAGEAGLVGSTPFIEKFRTDNGHYIYDCNTNRIVEVSHAMYDMADFLWQYDEQGMMERFAGEHSRESLAEGYRLLAYAVAHANVLSPARPLTRAPYPTEEQVARDLALSSPMLTLEVTQACNMRCRYCAYSGGYADRRVHSSNQMSWGTAEAAIAFYLGQSRPDDRPYVVTFYGGEPLLRLDLVRRVVEHCRSQPQMRERGVRFSLTTNGTLLTDDTIKYLETEGVRLVVSLDGDRDQHDRCRVFADGGPTHDLVMHNLRRLRDLTSREYRMQVRINCVMNPATRLLKLHDFFCEESDLFGDMRIGFAGVVAGHADFFAQCGECPTQADDMRRLATQFADMYANGTYCGPCVLDGLFQRRMVSIHKRAILEGPHEHLASSPACLPGGRKQYVAWDGGVHICEKINSRLPIGHVSSGLDIPRITRLIHEYAHLMNADDCRQCWAQHFCGQCYATLAEDGCLLQSRKDDACESDRHQALEGLIGYCSVAERNPQAWKPLDEVLVIWGWPISDGV